MIPFDATVLLFWENALVFFISKQYIVINICHFFTWDVLEVKHSLMRK